MLTRLLAGLDLCGFSWQGSKTMRVAYKLTLVVTGWVLIVLSVYGYYRLEEALALVEADLRRDERLIGSVLRPAVERAYVADGVDGAERVVAAANASEQLVRVRLVSLRSVRGALPAPVAPDAAVLATSGEFFVAPSGDGPRRLVSYLPLRLNGSEDHALELVIELSSERDFADRTWRELLIVLLLIGVCSFVLAGWFGWRVVGRRAGALVKLAQTVGAGEDPERVQFNGSDELAVLASEMNRMCDLLAASQASVEHAAQQRSQAIEQLRHGDRLATIGMLLAKVAHDVGTPLNVVSGRMKRIASGTVLGDDARRDATIALEQSDRIADTIRTLLDFSRSGSHASEPITATEILDKTCDLLATVARSHQVDLRQTDLTNGLRFETVPQLLQQALTNLTVNAIHASPKGSLVEMRAEILNPAPHPPAELGAVGPALRFSIVDAGSGIPLEIQERIFEPFFTTKPEGEGTGLGLPIAAAIAKDLGGWLSLSSTTGEGTRLELFIPVGDPRPPT